MTQLTVEDYKVMPETGPRYQLINGELIMAPAPNRFHQEISLNLTVLLKNWIDTNEGIGRIYCAPFDVHLDEINVFQPDLLYIRPDNFGILTEAGCSGPPDLIIEILSPRTRHIDLGPKKKTFAAKGVTELWIIDPDLRTIALYYLKDDVENPAFVVSEKETLTSPLLPGLELSGEKIFTE